MWGSGPGIWAFFLFLWMVGNTTASRPCIPKFVGSDAMVCVCNATYCDTVDPVCLLPKGYFLKYETSKAGHRMELTEGKFQLNSTSPGFLGLEYFFNVSERYQYIKGFGGSHTDAAAINILSLSPAAQNQLLRSYFADTGIEYNLLRMPIGSCDFSTRPYVYDEIAYDFDLKYFRLAEEDIKLRVKVLKWTMNHHQMEIITFETTTTRMNLNFPESDSRTSSQNATMNFAIKVATSAEPLCY